VAFIGDKLTIKYDADKKTYSVSGSGKITNGKNSVELKAGEILVNDKEIPVRSAPMQVLLTEDGKLENQFFD
jgi:hypothetical protein